MMIIKICAWCNHPIGIIARFKAFFRHRSQVSHGICWHCKEKQLKRLESILENKKKCVEEHTVRQELA